MFFRNIGLKSRIAFLISTVLILMAPIVGNVGHADSDVLPALRTFFSAWNTGDIDNVRATLNYPHVTLVGARMVIANEPEQFTTDFARMKRDEGWHASSLDTVEVGRVSGTKVECTAFYVRKNSDGDVYRNGRVAYIFTEKAGHAGMQFRAPLGTSVSPGSEEVRRARALLDEYFEAFNAADNARLQPLSNYPHAFLTQDGRLAVAESADELTINFEAMRRNEGWHRSTLDSVRLIHGTENQVHFDIVFSRLHEDGTVYRSVPARWIITNANGHWGLQFRSMMASL